MHGMINWFVRNSVAANLLMAAILALGAWSLASRLTLEIFPSFERDVVNISINYRGATPTEVEEAVVVRVEEAIADLVGIKEINSTAYEGACRVSIEVDKGIKPRDMLDDIKNRVDAIIGFPTDVEEPSYEVAKRTSEVISVAVTGKLSEKNLREMGEQIRDDIAALPEVTLVDLRGVRQYEMAIEVSENNLDRYGLTFDQVLEAVRQSSLDQPAGSIKTDAGEILLRTKGQSYTANDFAKISILNKDDGTRLLLSDVATIRDGFEEEAKATLFNDEPAVMIEVFRTGTQNAIKVAAAVREYVAEKKLELPDGINIYYWRDRSEVIKQRLNTLMKSAWQGGLLVLLCLTLFLRLSIALWVCLGIPISFMGALALMPVMGTTINLISLFAFILVLGIVVDDAIITGENIYSHMKRGEKGLRASIEGAKEVSVPVTFGLLTTLVAFAPLFMVDGIRGKIFAQIPLVVIPVLLFSWVESKLILPAHLSHINIHGKKKKGLLTRTQEYIADGLERTVDVVYRPLLNAALNYRYLTFAIFIAVSLVIISFIISGRYGYTFFPRVQSEIVRATLNMEIGTSEEITAKHVKRMMNIAQDLRKKYSDENGENSSIRNIMTSIGWSSSGSFGGGNPSKGNPELGQVSLELASPEERIVPIETFDLVNEWRDGIGPIPGVKDLSFRAELGHTGSPLAVQLTGDDFETLKIVIEEVRSRLSEYPGVFDIKDSLDDGKAEIELKIRPEAELLGISSADLGRQVRYAFFGAEAQRIQRGRDDVRVMIKYPREERKSIGNLDTMRIRTKDGSEVPMGNVTEVTPSLGYASIRRVDRHRAVIVKADIDKKRVDMNQITRDLTVLLDEMRQRFPNIRYSMEGEQREQRESFGSLFYGMIFMLFSIYALLAIPLKSYSQPFVVMLVIPFSLVGAIFGHMVVGLNLSIMSVMGCLALAGVVINDSLVLVDWINRRIAEGTKLGDAVRMAGSARFRPILLTSITTFAGLAPLIWEKSTQAQFLIPMAVSLGFGILYATLLSLILVPSGYLILDDMKCLFRRIKFFIFASD